MFFVYFLNKQERKKENVRTGVPTFLIVYQ